MDDTKPARGSRAEPGSIGGNLALDFANTASWVESGELDDRLNGYDDLIEWARGKDILSEGLQRELRAKALEIPRKAHEAMESARAVRRELRRVFSSFGEGGESRRPSLAALNEILSDLRLQIKRNGQAIALDWQIGADDLASVLRPIVWEATRLLTSDEVSRVKMCPGDRCGWLFVDNSRRRNRRWCDMRDCGNRAKARRHYQRHRVRQSEKR